RACRVCLGGWPTPSRPMAHRFWRTYDCSEMQPLALFDLATEDSCTTWGSHFGATMPAWRNLAFRSPTILEPQQHAKVDALRPEVARVEVERRAVGAQAVTEVLIGRWQRGVDFAVDLVAGADDPAPIEQGVAGLNAQAGRDLPADVEAEFRD